MASDKPPIPQSLIPLKDMKDPWLIAEKYSHETIQKTISFKERARDGAEFLSQDRITGHLHETYWAMIQSDIIVLCEASCIISEGRVPDQDELDRTTAEDN